MTIQPQATPLLLQYACVEQLRLLPTYHPQQNTHPVRRSFLRRSFLRRPHWQCSIDGMVRRIQNCQRRLHDPLLKSPPWPTTSRVSTSVAFSNFFSISLKSMLRVPKSNMVRGTQPNLSISSNILSGAK